LNVSRVLSSKAAPAFAIGTGVFLVDLVLLSRGVGTVDAGELAAAAATLGVPHPTGYPLFTLLMHLVSYLPLASRIIVRLNAFTALLSAAGSGLMFLSVRFALVKYMGVKNELHAAIAAAGAALLVSFTTVFWSQALSIEVYALHEFFVSLVMLLFLDAVLSKEDERRWALFAYVLGLSFANHMTTLLLVPGMMAAFFLFVGRRGVTRRFVLLILSFGLLGVSSYAFLLIRGHENPALNWGYPTTLERFVNHISGQQYRTWMFSSLDAAARQLGHFIELFPRDILYVPVVLLAAGVVRVMRRSWKAGAVFLLLIVTCLAYAVNFDVENKDIESYFLLAYITSAFFIAAGAAWLFEGVSLFVRGRGKAVERLGTAGVVAAIGVLVLLQALTNGREVDERDNILAEDYTKALLSNASQNALVISFQWDYFVSPFLYLQHVEALRPDVVVIDKELMRRSWYVESLLRRRPDVMGESAVECDAFIREVRKFERNLPYDGAVLDRLYYGMLTSIIEQNLPKRPVYVTYEVEPQLAPQDFRIPSGLLLRIKREFAWEPAEVRIPSSLSLRGDDPLVKQVRRWFAVALAQNALAAYRGGQLSRAVKQLDDALRCDPTFYQASDLKTRVLQGTLTP